MNRAATMTENVNGKWHFIDDKEKLGRRWVAESEQGTVNLGAK